VQPEITFREVNAENLEDLLAITLLPEQERFVGSIAEALEEAHATPEGKPWFRAVYDGEQPIGFVMLSWDVAPDPPDIIGPWFLWKLIVDRHRQGRGYGRAIVNRAAETVRAEGATELLTSYALGPGNPGPFYERVGFVPTGELDNEGEVIVSLRL